MIRLEKDFIYLETLNTLLVFEIKPFIYDDPHFNSEDKKLITQRYYGPKKDLRGLKASDNKMNNPGSNRDYNNDNLIYSYFGDGNNNETSLLILNSDNSYTNRFYFKEVKIIKGGVEIKGPHTRNVKETLDIVEVDVTSKLELHHYYSLCDDNDVISVKTEIRNNSDKDCCVDRIYSLETPVSSRNVKVYTYDGAWLEERYRHEVTLNSGVFVNASFCGSSSHKHNPFINVIDLDSNLYYGFNLIYSGNHKEMVEVNPTEHASVRVGINDFAFEYLLKANESFITPEAIMVVASSIDEVRRNMHEFVNSHIISPQFQYKNRPILFNSWEGSEFKINEESLYEMALIAKEIGIELFVIDDGWFKNRYDDYRALGDWTVDKNKFKNGLKPFAEKIKNLGLQFGIWVEPEMISRDSDLYRSHPEYALISKNRLPIERRHQLVIDMANPDVIDYLYESLSKVFIEADVDYVKWDYNRFISDIYSSTNIRAGEYFHRFIMGTYELLDRLTKRFPNVLFEGCASGGGRYDLGVSYYFPQTWGSDNSATYCRTYISCGTFEGYPQSTFGAHISRDGNGFTRTSSIEDRFNLNCVGGFGYEFDLRTFDKETLEIFKKQNEYFKKHQSLIQFGELSIIDNIFDDDRYYSFIINKGDEAILYICEINSNVPLKKWKCKYLDPNNEYEICFREQSNTQTIPSFTMSGKELMEEGIDIGSLSKKQKVDNEYQGIYSRLAYIHKK